MFKTPSFPTPRSALATSAAAGAAIAVVGSGRSPSTSTRKSQVKTHDKWRSARWANCA
jgi:hypothetical protein